MGKICKWVDWWRHTLNPILFWVYSYLCQFAMQNIETWQADSSTGNTPLATKKFVPIATQSSSPHPLDFNMLVIFSLKNVKQGHNLDLTYLYAFWIMHMKFCQQMSKWNAKGGKKAFKDREVWNPVCCHGNRTVKLVLLSTFIRILLQRIKHFWYKLVEISLFITFEQNLVECMTSSLG